jgi:FAD/FMN-containing dehydrogenase
MITAYPIDSDVEALRSRLDGEIVLPGEEAWDEARQAWNLAVDQRPAMVALPRTAEDVQELVGFARRRGLRVAMQGTGHNASPMGPLDGTMLVKTAEMRGVTIDAEDRVARVEAGALWADVTHPASELGLAPLAGSSPDVGVVGYTLGGGLSWLGRKYGLAAERLLAVELVTADGRLVRATRHNEPELFWALRGGGGNFGAVTAIEFELIPLQEVYAGMLLWPIERAREVLHAWREWTATVPDSFTTSARLLHMPPMPELPDFLRGRSLVVIDGAAVGDEIESAKVLAPLRALKPEIDTFAMVPPVALSYIHMDPEQPVPAMGDGVMIDALPAAAVDALVDIGDTPDSPLLMVEVRHLGGALARQGNGALGRFQGAYMTFAVGMVLDPAVVGLLEAQIALVNGAMAQYGSGRRYLNLSEAAVDPVAFFGEEAYARLREVKTAVDPLELFRGNHQIPAAS